MRPRVALLAVLLAACGAVHALSPEEIRARLDDDIPEDGLTALIEPWPGVPDRTIVAWVDDAAPASGQSGRDDGQDVMDLTVLVVRTADGQVLQRWHQDKAWREEGLQFDRLQLDAADWTLAPGARALGLRLLGMHRGCGAESDATLLLLEPAGATLRPLLSLQVEDGFSMCGCGETRQVHRTLQVARSASHGRADLVVRERRATTADGSSDPVHCHPRQVRTQSATTLRFDGARYPSLPAAQ